MLLDRFAPDPHFIERHRIEVHTTPQIAYRAIWTTDFGSSSLIKGLLWIRSLPSLLFRRDPTPRPRQSFTLQTIIDNGFALLAEEPGREVVLGVVGRFWRPTGNVEPFRSEYFSDPLPPGLAKAVWNFTVDQTAPGQPVIVSTETRVVCADVASQRKFAVYWSLIRPFSGLIRIIMLRAIQRACVSAN
ncbi:MAG: hypothetical protein HYR72_08705 [Deltaproteobacteria bacterium]|nr:hypothetical protein [Deltaproteobacteria bacterium]MBI3388834.1 hypothetical protein [Deltaproteobacteria bacterium]